MERPATLWREVFIWGICGVAIPHATWTGSYADAPPAQQWLYLAGASIPLLVGIWMAFTGRLLVWQEGDRGRRLGAPSAAFWSPYVAFIWVLIVVAVRILIGLVTGEPPSMRPLINALPGGTFAGFFMLLALWKFVVLIFGYHPDPADSDSEQEKESSQQSV